MASSLTVRQKREAALARTAESSALAKKRFVKGGEIVLADGSGSMDSSVAGTNPLQTRWQCLCSALAAMGDNLQVIVYEDQLHFNVGIDANSPRPYRGAYEYLHRGLEAALEFEPNYILVVGDGQLMAKGDENLSLEAARKLSEFSIIDTLYIGADSPRAEQFMQELARIGLGRYRRYDTTKAQQMALTAVVQGLLPPPSGDIAL